MEFEMLHAAGHALVVMLDSHRLLMLSCGVGILPGIGDLSGTALLLPLTFTMVPLRTSGSRHWQLDDSSAAFESDVHNSAG